MSNTTVTAAGVCSIKTENHGVSRDFQHIPENAAIEPDVLNDLIFDLSLLRCSCFMRHAVLLGKWSVKLASLGCQETS